MLRNTIDAYGLERILDPTGRRRADLLDAIATHLLPPAWWPTAETIIRTLDPGHRITGTMLRRALTNRDPAR